LKPLLVLCLGNDILTDDAFGSVVAKRLSRNEFGAFVEVIFAPTAGFGLLDLLKDREAVLIVDAIITGKAEPGTVHFFPAGVLTPSYNLINSHQINLPTALELGKQLGIMMPSDIQVVAVEAQDVQTIGEEMTPPVEKAVETVLAAVRNWVDSKIVERSQT
jgi:hydrogenase maturation protease